MDFPCHLPEFIPVLPFRGEEDDSLAIKPPQQMSRKEKTHHRKDEKRKEKRRHRSHSAEGASCHSWELLLSGSRVNNNNSD